MRVSQSSLRINAACFSGVVSVKHRRLFSADCVLVCFDHFVAMRQQRKHADLRLHTDEFVVLLECNSGVAYDPHLYPPSLTCRFSAAPRRLARHALIREMRTSMAGMHVPKAAVGLKTVPVFIRLQTKELARPLV